MGEFDHMWQLIKATADRDAALVDYKKTVSAKSGLETARLAALKNAGKDDPSHKKARSASLAGTRKIKAARKKLEEKSNALLQAERDGAYAGHEIVWEIYSYAPEKSQRGKESSFRFAVKSVNCPLAAEDRWFQDFAHAGEPVDIVREPSVTAYPTRVSCGCGDFLVSADAEIFVENFAQTKEERDALERERSLSHARRSAEKTMNAVQANGAQSWEKFFKGFLETELEGLVLSDEETEGFFEQFEKFKN